MRVPPGVTVFDAASWNGIAIDSTCGGHGTCKKCRIRIEDGDVPASPLDARAFTPQELEAGWRLACRAQAAADLEIEVPPLVTRPKAATVGVGRQVILRPALQKRYVELDEPTLQDQRSDFRRLQDAIDDLELRAEAGVLRRLPRVLRESDFRVTAVVVDDLLIDVEPGDTTGRLHRAGVRPRHDHGGRDADRRRHRDPGRGRVDAEQAAAVRRRRDLAHLGDDARRRRARAPDRRSPPRRCRSSPTTCAQQAGIEPAQVYEVALAGNATMTSIALGVDPEPLGVAPFILAAQSYPEMPAAELGLDLHPDARATVFPALGAYVGGDIVAGMLATGMTRDRRLRLLIDVGTNCEVVLGSADGVVCTAAPAGPAFEAAQIACGMRAAEGAIEVVRLRDGAVELDVIGDAEPAGICGSGLVDAAAELVRVGLLDKSGRFVPEEEAERIEPQLASRLTARADGTRIFVLHWAAARATSTARSTCPSATSASCSSRRRRSRPAGGCWSRSSASPRREIQQVLLAGSFGSYLSPRSAIRIGLVPKLAAAADRLRRQRRRRGREDGAALAPGAPRGGGDAGRGAVHRALRPPGLQRPVRRAAGVSGMSANGSCPRLWRARPRGAARSCRRTAGSTSTCVTSPPSCTPRRGGSRRRSKRRSRTRTDATTACSSRTPIAAPPAGSTRCCGRYGATRLAGAHCYAVYAGLAEWDALQEEEPGTFYLTDFFVRNFDSFVGRPLGLDRYPELIGDILGNYRRVVYLAQTDDPALYERAEECAASLGLAFECRRTGYGRLAPSLSSFVAVA